MPTNDFLPYAQGGGANVVSQASYAADPLVGTGRGSGILPSNFYNKSLRQGSVGSYLLGQLIVDILGVDALDNASVATVLANLKLAIAKTPTQPTVQRLTSGSGTYTPTSANVRRIRVRMVGGGGGGSARVTNNGNAGGTSSFGSWTAIFGGFGTVASNGGAGGTGGVDGTGTLIMRFAGSGGDAATANSAAGNQPIPGRGGSNPFGGGAAAPTSGAGLPASTNTGGGGSGGGSASATNSGSGGGSGEYVEFFVNNPTATSYTVGAGGTGGAAGTTAGGNGASGCIIVEELYV